ncbi:hypothetical protein COL154_006481 [Colletotrichum chrysophilum]|uniref:uncharacterized protein n=1 Tax=Colletotrichum chrysophilum TaxID=1836956 RepID=UPI0022FFDDC9|nr:uncharacterized protein COL26b_005988 [Colletotrichum chrysophilum]KAJ0348789.1 hypothetical protein KNSL1_005194 [Colletotrichum chrysophilum]KAJ0361970.1 hypothetical protein COL154_006481 [Colletotrichum chrysophilum]KAJ0375837.1 hypothetical protein COL26b_005988 [Colletotrichum chrysophilum]
MAALKSLSAIRAKYVQKQQEKVKTAAVAAAAPDPFQAVANWNWEGVNSPVQQSHSAVARQFTDGSNPSNGADYCMAGMCAPAQGYNNDVPNAGVVMDIDDASYNSPDVSMSDVSSDFSSDVSSDVSSTMFDMDMDIVSDAIADITMSDVPYASPEIHMSDAWIVGSLCDEDHSDNMLKILEGKKRATGLLQLEDSQRLRPREANSREHIAAEISNSRATIEKWQKVLEKIRLEMQSGHVDPWPTAKWMARGECLLAEEWKRLDRLDMEYYMASKYVAGLHECCVW